MPGDTKEPQSYGSGKDWVTGKTGQEVNPHESEPTPEHRGKDQGGKISDVQLAESDTPNEGSRKQGG